MQLKYASFKKISKNILETYAVLFGGRTERHDSIVLSIYKENIVKLTHQISSELPRLFLDHHIFSSPVLATSSVTRQLWERLSPNRV